MKTSLLILLFVVFSPLLSKEREIKKKIENLTDRFVKEHSITSLAVIAVGQDGEAPFEQIVTRGTLSIHSLIPVNQYSTFRIGPLTQLFTAFALASFVEEGRVSLDDPASKFLPKSIRLPTYRGKEITLGDLATHTSALPDLADLSLHFSPFRISQLYRFLSKYELSREPGTQYEFSNFGYAFLAHLLSCISKKNFPDLLNQILSKELGLDDVTFIPSLEQKSRLVMGYERKRAVRPLFKEKTYSVLMGSEGLYLTPFEILSFLSSNLYEGQGSRLDAIFSIMRTSYRAFETFRVGLGWKIHSFGNERHALYSIGGNFLGFGAYIGMIPETKRGVAILYNQGKVEPAPFAEKLLRLMHQI